MLLPKPVSHRLERIQKRKQRQSHERTEKAKVRQRDKHCRWPGCVYWKDGLLQEVAHLYDKGMGGDHGVRTSADQMMLLCHEHHQGRRSLHSGDLRIEPLTERGTDGPCEFQTLIASMKGKALWFPVAREVRPGVQEKA